MQIDIHGGMFKTATTAAQRVMTRQRDTMIAAGIFYPAKNAPANHILNVRRPDWSPDPVLDQIKAAQALGCDRIIFSGEAVSILNADEIATLRACMTGHRVRFVFSFRHWAEYLPSRWSTYSLRRDSQPLSAYINRLRTEFPMHIDLHFHQLAERFNAAGDEFRAVSYSNEKSQGQSAISALFQALELPTELAKFLLDHCRFENTRRAWDQVEMIRLLNGVVAQHLALNQDDLCHSIGTFGVGNIPFVLERHLDEIPSEISEPLLDRIHKARTVLRIDPNEVWLEQILEKSQARCARHFTNLVDDRVFADPKATETECTELVWSRDVPGGIAPHLMAQPFMNRLTHP